MDRHSNNSGMTAADALLQQLKNDLLLNENDKEAIAREEEAAKNASTKRYRFRVMKKADYLEKKRIAETIAMAADDAEISDEDLEALLRTYLKETPRVKPVIENTAEIIPVTPAEDREPSVSAPKIDLDQPLSPKEVPFFEELDADADFDDILDAIDVTADPTEEALDLADAEKDSRHAADIAAAADETVQPEADADEILADIDILDDDTLAALLDTDFPEDMMEPADDKADAILPEDIAKPVHPETEIAPAPAATPVDRDEEEAAAPLSDDDDLMALLASIDEEEDTFLDAFADDTPNPAAAEETAIADETPIEEVLAAPTAKERTAISDEELASMLAAMESEDDDIALTEEGAEDDAFPTDKALSDETDPMDAALTDDDLDAVLADIPDDMLDLSPEDDFTADDLPEALPTEDPPAGEKSAAADATDFAPAADDEFDQTDLDLMIAFGMEDQIEKAVGSEQAKKYKKAIGERGENHYNEMHMGDRPDTVLDKHAEYVSAAQNKEIFSEYKKKYSGMLFRFLGALFFLLLLFFFENDKLLGIQLPALFDREQYPLVYTLFDLQLVVLSGAMVWKGIRTGIRAIFRGRPVPESITGFLFLACLVYTAVIASLCPMHGLQIYNFPIALAVIFELCYEFMNLRREIMSFKIVSSKKLKYAVDAIAPKDGEAEKRMFAEYISDDPALFRIKRTAFVENFFARTETYPRTQRILRAVIPAVLLLTLAFFAAAFMLAGDVYDALTAAYITLLLTLPSCAFIMFSYPMYRASGFAYEKESAMIGEASLGEYADASVVTFDDKEVFPSRGVRVRNVKVYGNNRIDHVIYAAASVFHVVGGPLSDVFETATGELGYAENVKLIRLDHDGIESRVDNRTVLIGRAAFVNRYGYNVTLSESETSMEETGDACILYVAYDNNIAAKLYIQYAVDPDFEVVLKQLYRQGICVGIKTSDPNIDDHLLSCKIKMSKYPVKIIKCAEPKETAIIVDRLSSGIVSKASAKSLLQTLAICDRVLSASRTNNVLGIVSILLGMAAMAFFIISGMSITVAPLFIALYQLFWVIPVIAVARYYI